MGSNDIGVTIEDVRALASTLERSYEAIVRDRVKFRVGQIVYLAFSRDDSLMGFAFPKEERDGLVAWNRTSSCCPSRATCATTGSWFALPRSIIEEMTELVVEAWRMVVPKKVFAPTNCREQT